MKKIINKQIRNQIKNGFSLDNYLWARYAMDTASNLNMEMRDIAFKFNSVMSGVTTQPERWQTCTAKSSGTADIVYNIIHNMYSVAC